MNRVMTIDTMVLDEIPFRLNLDTLVSKLRAREQHVNSLQSLAKDARAVGRPKALYRVAYVEDKEDDCVIIEGVTLTSRVLRVNLEHAHRVFAYVATCGMELEEWARSIDDLLQSYWAETIKEMALGQAIEALNRDIVERFRPGKTATMAPGSLEDWPLEQQQPLFTLLGDTEAAIAVRLTKSLMMVPTKSVSGIRFPTAESFESCQLCPREKCPGRRAPYDAKLYARKYRQRRAGQRARG
jgi:hypothetical protein